jgi:hypothetical protein
MSNPQMTVRQLHAALTKILREHADRPVTIWLPGSKIDLHGVIGPMAEPRGGPVEVLIEGNLRDGSALGNE